MLPKTFQLFYLAFLQGVDVDQKELHSFWRSDRGSLPGPGNCLLQGLQSIMTGDKCQRLLISNDNCRPLPFHRLVAEN